MGPHDKIWIANAEALSAWDRLRTFLAPYDLRIFLNDVCYVDIGSASLGCVGNLTFLSPPKNGVGLIGSIGRFCEFAVTSEVMGHAEHNHDRPMNISSTLLRSLTHSVDDIGMKPFQPFEIGHGVVLSSGSKVLPGARIGDGAVAGAGAIVTRDVDHLTIVAGVPARPIRKRPPFYPWWDFAFDYLLELGDDIQTAATSEGPHRWRGDQPRFALRKTVENYDIFGFSVGDDLHYLSEAPETVRAYLAQAFSSGESYLMPNCWA